MKLFTDFLPIILFFIAYKFGGGVYHWNGQEYEVAGIYAATAVMMVATLIQVLWGQLRHGKVERQHMITLILVMVLGGATIWLQNTAWILFFVFSGFLNIYIAYNYSEETWVNFKLFGSLIITVVFIAGQAIYLSRHINDNTNSKDAS